MTRQTIAAVFSVAATLAAASSAKAGLIATASIAEYQSPVGYDFSDPNDDPPTTYQNIGTFTFAPVSTGSVGSITISGTFGNPDFGFTTALSDYFLGDATDGRQAVKVAQCDSASANCYSGQEGPYAWSFRLTGAQITALASGLAHGSIDFGYTWGQGTPAISDPFFGDANGFDPQFVNAGAATLAVFSPEPATVFFAFGGLAGILTLCRSRKA
jgi:hypothetical protein